MKDPGLVCIGAFIMITYIVYIVSHVLTHQPVPNGLILSGVIGALMLIAGKQWGGFAKQQEIIKSRGYTDYRDYVPPK